MTFLSLQPLSGDRLAAAVALDQRCFGGLWTLEGYQRELESPNSELLVLMAEAEGRGQGAEGAEGAGAAEGVGAAEGAGAAEGLGGAGEVREHLHLKLKTQNSKLKTHPSSFILHPSSLLPPPSPLLGLGCYWAILEEAHITMLAIDPAYQRQGLGQALLCALMASAHACGLERATLEVRASNAAALSLYQKFEFREAGRRRRYYPDNGEDALVLWRGGLQAPDFSECLTDWQQQARDRLQGADWQCDKGGSPHD